MPGTVHPHNQISIYSSHVNLTINIFRKATPKTGLQTNNRTASLTDSLTKCQPLSTHRPISSGPSCQSRPPILSTDKVFGVWYKHQSLNPQKGNHHNWEPTPSLIPCLLGPCAYHCSSTCVLTTRSPTNLITLCLHSNHHMVS